MKTKKIWVLAAILICGTMVLTSCKSNDDNAVPDTSALELWQAGKTVTAEVVVAFGGIDKCFAAEPIPDGVWARMQGKTFKENPYIGRDDLRHVRALHWDYDNQIRLSKQTIFVSKSAKSEGGGRLEHCYLEKLFIFANRYDLLHNSLKH